MDTAFRIILTAILAGILGSQFGIDSEPAEAVSPETEADHTEADHIEATDTALAVDEDESVDETVADPEPLAFRHATPAQMELTNEAIATFEAAGMELPPLVVTFDVDGDACKGHPGLFTSGVPATIQLCTELRHVLLHELAHAWEWYTLDDSTRDDFVDRSGLPTWNSRDHEWGDRGVERMADTVAIGLTLVDGSDNPVVIERLCSFEQITGVEHPALTEADCDRTA